jgi:hypothetical protein
MYILMRGNPQDGYKFIGPFASFDEADAYQQTLSDRGPFDWIATLSPP